MFGGCVRLMWWLLKPARVLTRLLIYLLLATIPIWGLSFISGFVDGSIMAHLRFQYNDQALVTSVHEMQLARWQKGFEVPGAPLDKWAPGPFYIPKLEQPLYWWRSFDLVRHFQDLTVSDLTKLTPIASPHGLYRKHNITERDQGEWHHWIYASPGYSFYDLLYDEWDIAFNHLLQYHAANPAAHNASFHSIACGSSSLCLLWRIKGPALIHMTNAKPIEYFDFSKENSADAFYFQDSLLLWDEFPEFDGHDKVTFRVAELPLLHPMGDPYILPPGKFPSRFEQMRSITSDERIWQELPLMAEAHQIFSVLDDYCKELQETHKQTYGRLQKITTYVSETFGIDDSDVDMMAVLFGLFFGSTFSHYAILLYRTLFGYGHYPDATTQQEIATAIWEVEMGNPPNLMESMLDQFLLQLPDEIKRGMARNDEMMESVHKMRNFTRYGVTE